MMSLFSINCEVLLFGAVDAKPCPIARAVARLHRGEPAISQTGPPAVGKISGPGGLRETLSEEDIGPLAIGSRRHQHLCEQCRSDPVSTSRLLPRDVFGFAPKRPFHYGTRRATGSMAGGFVLSEAMNGAHQVRISNRLGRDETR